jgi:Ca-activated chloride channel homolog
MRRLLAVAAISLLAGCRSKESTPAKVPPVQAVVLRVAYGSEKRAWLEEQVRLFEATSPRTASGRPIRVAASAQGSGEALDAVVAGDGREKPHVFSPASSAYVTLLDRALQAQGRTRPVAPQCEPLVLSPVVVAMWRPMAEALGWPGKALGWKDLLAVAARPGGWADLDRPEWGAFKFGHTHPESSNSGLLAVLAEAYAGARKVRGLGADDLAARATRDFVARVEGTVVHYGKSTGFFAEKMLERGPAYLSAAVLYENLVIESYGKQPPFPLVAIYPVEGTFWSDHPYCVLDAEWVGQEERDAAARLLAFLRARPAQERALAHGFRPADTSVAVGAPIDSAHGVDPKQPQTLLDVPSAEVLEGLLALFRQSKKPSDVVLVFDKSGSMNGRPLAQAKEGARAFLDGLSARDRVSLMFFDHRVLDPSPPIALGEGKAELVRRIDAAIADGGTALYDATLAAVRLARERARREPALIHAVVVMTDGKDESSRRTLRDLQDGLKEEGEGSAVKVFTIGYGEHADDRTLQRIAEAGQGQSARGSVETIVQVYRDMASFF